MAKLIVTIFLLCLYVCQIMGSKQGEDCSSLQSYYHVCNIAWSSQIIENDTSFRSCCLAAINVNQSCISSSIDQSLIYIQRTCKYAFNSCLPPSPMPQPPSISPPLTPQPQPPSPTPQPPSFPPSPTPLPPSPTRQPPSSPPSPTPQPPSPTPQPPSSPPSPTPQPPSPSYNVIPIPLPNHPTRPKNCLTDFVKYDSCYTFVPQVNQSATPYEKQYYPQQIAKAVLGMGPVPCCVAIAVFDNNCDPLIRDLSPAKLTLFQYFEQNCQKLRP